MSAPATTGPSTGPTTAELTAADLKRLNKVGLSVLIGTCIEWYDFQLYGAAAALVFGSLFFKGSDPLVATIQAFATFAVGFFARPVGGVILGHFGDRVGRKAVLVFSLVLMGLATSAIGLLPTYDTVGALAPTLLVVMRLIQGFGVGGEWGGAVLTAVEHAPKHLRGFYGSLPQAGVPAGLLMATFAIWVTQHLTGDDFATWGWRVPFLLSIVLVLVGLWIRMSLEDASSFKRVKDAGEQVKVPIVDAFKRYPRQILLGTMAIISSGAYFYITNTYTLSFAKQRKLISGDEMQWAVMCSAIASTILIPIFGALSERYGRRKLILIGVAGMGFSGFPAFWAIESGSFLGTAAALVLGSVFFSLCYGGQATFIAELFDAKVRYSAATIAYQIGILLGGALAPMIAATLVKQFDSGTPVAGYIALLSAVSFIGAWFIKQQDVTHGSEDMLHDHEVAAGVTAVPLADELEASLDGFGPDPAGDRTSGHQPT